jgi:hypothetical protein
MNLGEVLIISHLYWTQIIYTLLTNGGGGRINMWTSYQKVKIYMAFRKHLIKVAYMGVQKF